MSVTTSLAQQYKSFPSRVQQLGPPGFEVDDSRNCRRRDTRSGSRYLGTMPSRKTAKLVAVELLQFAAFAAPPLTVLERFASLVRLHNGLTSYWLTVAVSIAYVTSATLLVWLPLKYVVRKRRTSENQQWWVEWSREWETE